MDFKFHFTMPCRARLIAFVFLIATLTWLPGLSKAETPPTTLDEPVNTLERENDLTFKPAPPGHTSVRAETINILNADKILHRELKLGFAQPYARRGLVTYGGEVVRIKGEAEWVQFSGYKATGWADYKPRPHLMLSASAGGGSLTLHEFAKRNFGEKKDIPLWRLRANYTPWTQTDFRLEANNDFSYFGWMDRWNRAQVMPVQNLFAEVESFRFAGWQLRSNARLSFFTDSNHQQNYDHLILRDLFTFPFVLRAGVGGGWQSYKDQLPGYWSPAFFEAYGARLLASKDFFTYWNIEARLNYGFHKETRRPIEPESSTGILVRYQRDPGWNIQLSGNFLNSNRGAWWQQDVGLRLEAPL